MGLFGWDILRERNIPLKKKKKARGGQLQQSQYILNDLKESFLLVFFFHQISLFGAFKC